MTRTRLPRTLAAGMLVQRHSGGGTRVLEGIWLQGIRLRNSSSGGNSASGENSPLEMRLRNTSSG